MSFAAGVYAGIRTGGGGSGGGGGNDGQRRLFGLKKIDKDSGGGAGGAGGAIAAAVRVAGPRREMWLRTIEINSSRSNGFWR